MGLIDDKATMISTAEDVWAQSLTAADRQLVDQLVRVYAKYVSGGVLVFNAEFLAQLEADIIAAIAKTDYREGVNAYVRNFDTLRDMNLKIHKKVNKVDINAVVNENAKVNNFINAVTSQLKAQNSTVVQYLTEEGVLAATKVPNKSLSLLVEPIANMVREDIITGLTFQAAEAKVLAAIESQQLGLSRWAGQISRDALMQSDGVMQDQAREEFDMKYVRYIGGIRQGTRPFCYHLLTRKEEAVFSMEEVATALDEFCPAGVPSTAGYTYTPVTKKVTREKGGGMIPGTTIQNFFIYRGGYNCRHEAIPAVSGEAIIRIDKEAELFQEND